MRRIQTKLKALLEQSSTTADFLQDVIASIESLYAEEGVECPDGFEALDRAVSAFQASELAELEGSEESEEG